MTESPSRSETGRGVLPRPVLLAAGVILIVGGVVAAGRLRDSAAPRRGPIAEPNPAAQPPVARVEAGIRHIDVGEPAEWPILDTVPPTDPSRLLWFRGQPAQRLADGGSVVLDGGGGIIRFDDELRVHRVRAKLQGRIPVSVAADTGNGYWIADASGDVSRISSDGNVVDTMVAPFAFPEIFSSPAGDDVWVVRSNQHWAYRLAKPDEPLLARLDPAGNTVKQLGGIQVPQHVLLADLANAGRLVVDDTTVFYAPFIRDELIAMNREGDTLWVAHRGLEQAVDEPRFVVEKGGSPYIDYAPVNLGIAKGPDGLLYVLSIQGTVTDTARLDGFDPATGALIRSVRVESDVTVSVDEAGRIYKLDPFRLITGVAPREREEFSDFDLPTLEGTRMTSDDLRGKVVLVNLWASWCGPCREEMPALDSLQAGIDNPDFMFITLNEDVAASDAQAFIDEFGFDFPVVLGGGGLRSKYHYIGLPTTILVDREGREIERWVGYAGEEQLQTIRALAEAELAREGAGGHHHAGMDMGR
ncbi:MAG: redoxin family protein [Gemmatimonadales bacterium]